MNVGILIMPDGSPCLVYDEKLGTVVHHIEFSYADYRVTIFYEEAPPVETDDVFGTNRPAIQKLSKIARKTTPTLGQRKLDYPLEHDFVELLEKTKAIGVTNILDSKLVDIRIVPVLFTRV